MSPSLDSWSATEMMLSTSQSRSVKAMWFYLVFSECLPQGSQPPSKKSGFKPAMLQRLWTGAPVDSSSWAQPSRLPAKVRQTWMKPSGTWLSASWALLTEPWLNVCVKSHGYCSKSLSFRRVCYVATMQRITEFGRCFDDLQLKLCLLFAFEETDPD